MKGSEQDLNTLKENQRVLNPSEWMSEGLKLVEMKEVTVMKKYLCESERNLTTTSTTHYRTTTVQFAIPGKFFGDHVFYLPK